MEPAAGSLLETALSQFLVTTALVNTGYFLGAVAAWWLALRLLDKAGGQVFTDLWPILRSEPRALALYLGARILAVALLAQSFLS